MTPSLHGSSAGSPGTLLRILAALSALLVVTATIAEARPTRIEGVVPDGSAAGDGPLCEDGIVRDDGSAETGYGWVPSVVDGRYVQEYQLSEVGSDNLSSFCVCWRRTQPDADLDFEVQVYRHEQLFDESEGEFVWVPEREPYAVFPASATGITDDVGGTWVEVDLENVELPLGPFFSVGVRWDPSVDRFFFVCADTSEGTPPSNAWFIDDRADGWASALDTLDPVFSDHRAVMMRIVPGPRSPVPVEIPLLGTSALVLLAAGLAFTARVLIRRRADRTDRP